MDSIRRFFIRARHWEYWPFDILYLPVYVYWIWLSLRARSFFFFSAANPGIKNAGFLLESKKDIYDQIPVGSYPETMRCLPGMHVDQLLTELARRGIVYPLIAKPDVGQRGLRVSRIHNLYELMEYMAGAEFAFLIQEFVSYENEVGIFYYRMPGERDGRISGIVGKEFLTLIGDGRSSIEQLLIREDR